MASMSRASMSIILIFVFFSMLPSLHSSSRIGLQGGTAAAEDEEAVTTISTTATTMQGNKRYPFELLGNRGVEGAVSAAFVTEEEESAREVPTGPNPLHHNRNPKPRH